MKALSGYAEWFWLMAKGWKDVENRPRPLPQSLAVSLPVRIYLHASKSDHVQRVPGDLEFILSHLTSAQLAEFCDVDWSNLRGKIIGEVTITGQMKKRRLTEADHVSIGCQDRELGLLIASEAPCMSPWFFGPFGYTVMDGALYEAPIPCKGMLGFFDPVMPIEEIGKVENPYDETDEANGLWLHVGFEVGRQKILALLENQKSTP